MNTETLSTDTIKQLKEVARKQARKQVRKAKTPKTNDQVPVEQAASEVPTPKKGKRNLADTMARYRAGYVDGKSCGDATASRLAGMSLEAVIEEAEKVSGLESGVLFAKYASLNLGQRRMCAGNRIRAAAKKAAKQAEAKTA